MRPQGQVHNHTMPGGYDEELLQNAVALSANAWMVAGRLWVTVDVTNDQTGHNVPTDLPLRHLILLIEATDAAGQKLVWRSGRLLPAWAGEYGGEPGRIFAKILRDGWTGEMPTGAI